MSWMCSLYSESNRSKSKVTATAPRPARGNPERKKTMKIEGTIDEIMELFQRMRAENNIPKEPVILNSPEIKIPETPKVTESSDEFKLVPAFTFCKKYGYTIAGMRCICEKSGKAKRMPIEKKYSRTGEAWYISEHDLKEYLANKKTGGRAPKEKTLALQNYEERPDFYRWNNDLRNRVRAKGFDIGKTYSEAFKRMHKIYGIDWDSEVIACKKDLKINIVTTSRCCYWLEYESNNRCGNIENLFENIIDELIN